MQHALQVMDPTGHTTVNWDPGDEDSVAVAAATFKEMTAKGYNAFRVAPGPGVKMKTFDPTAEKMILVPHLAGG